MPGDEPHLRPADAEMLRKDPRDSLIRLAAFRRGAHGRDKLVFSFPAHELLLHFRLNADENFHCHKIRQTRRSAAGFRPY